jgi:hypothetical protein
MKYRLKDVVEQLLLVKAVNERRMTACRGNTRARSNRTDMALHVVNEEACPSIMQRDGLKVEAAAAPLGAVLTLS